ncbi:MAG: hypothetical protein II220_05740 [Spirochaetales bacterium]|nr:hypothetical protein [Spirochaetales bacterium]
MTATRRYICNDISLDIQTLFGTISQQPTANSQQPTANSQQPTANIQFSYIYIFSKSSLGIRSVFSLHFVRSFFFYVFLVVFL